MTSCVSRIIAAGLLLGATVGAPATAGAIRDDLVAANALRGGPVGERRVTSDSACSQLWRGTRYDRAYLTRAWRHAGRAWLQQNSGLHWDSTRAEWISPPNGAPRPDPAQDAYALAVGLHPAIHAAAALSDTRWLEELAAFYDAYANNFVDPVALRRQGVKVKPVPGEGSARVLLEAERSTDGEEKAECMVCSAQFVHTMASLIRVVASVPRAQRTPSLTRFARRYTPVVLQDHVMRWLVHGNRNRWGVADLDSSYLVAWKELAGASEAKQHRHEYAVLDTDLWMIGISAELLAANHADPDLVRLRPAADSTLRVVVSTGVILLRSRMTTHGNTRDFANRLAPSVGLFEGHFDDFPDMRYAGDTGAALPEGAPVPRVGTSWDVSHAVRIPQVISSLAAYSATSGQALLTDAEVGGVVRQFAYRVFQHDLTRPRLANFFDGSDGWYRVGYHGPKFGYPPSKYCDSRHGWTPCLQTTGFFGWGLLGKWNPDLCRVERGVADLAVTGDSGLRDFGARYFTFADGPFIALSPDGTERYPFVLFALLADNASYLR